jgi:hypothetical protein
LLAGIGIVTSLSFFNNSLLRFIHYPFLHVLLFMQEFCFINQKFAWRFKV